MPAATRLGPRRVAIVHFDALGEPLDAEMIEVPNGFATPVHFLRDWLSQLDHWPVGAVRAKGFFDHAVMPLFFDLPRSSRRAQA